MLYYLRQEVIGDLAERILEGADSRFVDGRPFKSYFLSFLLCVILCLIFLKPDMIDHCFENALYSDHSPNLLLLLNVNKIFTPVVKTPHTFDIFLSCFRFFIDPSDILVSDFTLD